MADESNVTCVSSKECPTTLQTVETGFENVIVKLEQPFVQTISDEALYFIKLVLIISLCSLVSLFGVLSNIVNMIVFSRQGLKDSMNVCLFELSLTDFVICFIIFVSRMCPIWDTFFSTEYADPMSVRYIVFDFVADSMFLASDCITTYMSLERCICVIFPFKVKKIFTRNRAILALIIIWILITAPYMPVYVSQWLGWADEEIVTANGTIVRRRLIARFTENRHMITRYSNIISISVIPLPCIAITLGSVIWMIYSLNASSKLRQTMTANTTDSSKDTQDSKLEQKTRRFVKVVLFIAIAFIVLSVPLFYASFVFLFYKESTVLGRERNLRIFKWQLARFGTATNASINIFVYMIVNFSYRTKFKELFLLTSKSK